MIYDLARPQIWTLPPIATEMQGQRTTKSGNLVMKLRPVWFSLHIFVLGPHLSRKRHKTQWGLMPHGHLRYLGPKLKNVKKKHF